MAPEGAMARPELRVVAGRPVREYEYAEPIGAVDITEDADGLGGFRGILFAIVAGVLSRSSLERASGAWRST
jgi:hypothetical protein